MGKPRKPKASDLRRIRERYLKQIDQISLLDPGIQGAASTQAVEDRPTSAEEEPAPPEVGAAEAPAVFETPTEPTAVPLPIPPPLPTPPPLAPPDQGAGPSREATGGQGWLSRLLGRRAIWALLTLAIGVGGGGFLSLRRWTVENAGEIHQVFPLPFTYSVGLVAHRGLLHSLDRKRLLLFSFGPDDGKILGLRKFSATTPTGLAASESYFWSANAETGYIFQHNLDSEFTVRGAFASKDRRPTALYWDGSHLWNADALTETVYEYTGGASLLPARQFTLPGLEISGLYVSNEVLWAMDSVTRQLYRYKLKTLPVAIDHLRLDEWLPATSQVTGMAVVGNGLWIITERPAGLHRFDLTRLSWSSRSPAPPQPAP